MNVLAEKVDRKLLKVLSDVRLSRPTVFRKPLGAYVSGLGRVSMSGTVFSAHASDSSIRRSTGSFVTDGVIAGAWVRPVAFADEAFNRWALVLEVAADRIVLDSTVPDLAAGRKVGLQLATDIDTRIVLGDWDRQQVNGETIKATDAMIIARAAPFGASVPTGNVPEPERWSAYPWGTSGRSLSIVHVSAIAIGADAPVLIMSGRGA